MKLNEKLHSYRKKSGLSQQELAEQLDVSRQSVSKWETGITVPSGEKLILLSKLYNVPLTILTDDDVELKEKIPQFCCEWDLSSSLLSSLYQEVLFLGT